MKIELRDAAERLQAANNIVVTAHVNPDGDAIGSSLALLLILRAMGKQVRVLLDDDIPPNFAILPNMNDIEHPVELTETEIVADLLVVLDTQPDRIGSVLKLVKAPILNIDHHITNEGKNVSWLFLNANAAATCEIIFDLIEFLPVALNEDLAHCLYAGMATDTGFFNYANTRPSTLRAAAVLIEAGVKPNVIAEEMERKSLADFKGLCEALKTMEFFFEGRVAGLFINEAVAHLVDSTEGFIDQIRVIDGVEVAFVLTCKGDDTYRVSMRSRTVDVSKIARNLGGGGHIRAAGCTLRMSFDEARATLLKAIGEAIGEAID